MATGLVTMTCACGEEFTPRRKDEAKCPACRILDEEKPRRSFDDNGAHANGDNGAALDLGRVSPDLGRLRADMPPQRSRDPQTEEAYRKSHGVTPPARRRPRTPVTPGPGFEPDAAVGERRARILSAIVGAGGEREARSIADELGLLMSTVQNDLARLVHEGKVFKLRLAGEGRRVIFRTPERQAQLERDGDAPQAAADEAREALVQEAEDDARERGHADEPELPPHMRAEELITCAEDGCEVRFRLGLPGDQRIFCPEHSRDREELPPPQSETPPSHSALATAARRAGRPDLAVRVEEMLGVTAPDRAAWRDRYLDALLCRIRNGHECPETVYARVEALLALDRVDGG